MTKENTKYWTAFKTVPKDHVKPFQQSGGFKGTAIKPMWQFLRMTEEFGPCGTGWGIHEPKFDVQAAGNEILVFCTATVWYGPERAVLVGVGGDKILAQQKSGPRMDDNAYKKAFTDAITNALKMLGMAADVHMGLYDGNKYVPDEPEERREPEPHQQEPAGSPPAQSETFLDLKDMLGKIEDGASLDAWIAMGNERMKVLSKSEIAVLKNMLDARRAYLAQKP